MKQKLLFLLLALLPSAMAWAAVGDEFTSNGLKFRVTSELPYEVELYGYETEPTGSLTILSFAVYKYQRYMVTAIGDVAFKGCDKLTSVTIPYTVKYIGNDSFNGCDNLKDVFCYANVSLTWTDDGDDFKASHATYCHVGSAIWNQEHPEVNVAFATDLNSYSKMITQDGITFRTMGDLEAEVTGYSGYKENLTIPDLLSTKSSDYMVTRISVAAFRDCSGLKTVAIPGSIISIGDRAFMGCSGLTSLTIPETVLQLSSNAFALCSGLTTLTFPGSLAEIPASCFYGCTGLKSVVISEGVQKICQNAFWECNSLKSVIFPASLTWHEYYNFYSIEDIYCYIDPDDIEYWLTDQGSYKPDGSTKCHVPANKLDKFLYLQNNPTVDYNLSNLTFVGDLTTPTLTDGEDYTRPIDMNVSIATYQKPLGAERVGKHQAWLVPFDYTISASAAKTFSFYKINMIANSPAPGVESTDEMWVFLTKMNEGEVLHANMPYVYKPLKVVESYNFMTPNTQTKAPKYDMLLKTETTTDIYKFYATYEDTEATGADPFYYVNTNGGLSYGYGDDSDVTVGPYRWIIRTESKLGGTSSYVKEMHFVDGEEDGETGISLTPAPSPGRGEIYNLAGQMVNGKWQDGKWQDGKLPKGIYIVSGKKILVK